MQAGFTSCNCTATSRRSYSRTLGSGYDIIRARRLDERGHRGDSRRLAMLAASSPGLRRCDPGRCRGSPGNLAAPATPSIGSGWRTTKRGSATSPLILAGGLTPENVAEAIRIVRPQAVDVASGVESAPGKKDAAKMRDFVAAARAAFAAL